MGGRWRKGGEGQEGGGVRCVLERRLCIYSWAMWSILCIIHCSIGSGGVGQADLRSVATEHVTHGMCTTLIILLLFLPRAVCLGH